MDAHRVVGGDGAVDEAVDAAFFRFQARRRRSSLKASVSRPEVQVISCPASTKSTLLFSIFECAGDFLPVKLLSDLTVISDGQTMPQRI